MTVDPDGKGAKEAKTATVQCASADDSDVCKAVDGMKPEVFKPVPGDIACTQQYGGPETATVKGTLHGETIDANFSRERLRDLTLARGRPAARGSRVSWRVTVRIGPDVEKCEPRRSRRRSTSSS